MAEKRYRIECHAFDGMGEDDEYDMHADTLEEAEAIAAEEARDGDGERKRVVPEIIDTSIRGG
jgi:hypothetical protein